MAEEYIKKEDAIQSVVNHDLLKDEWSRDWAGYMLEDAKPADVAPVRHGIWKINKYGDTVCSICDMPALRTLKGCLANRRLEPNETKYCPFCGARMDGDEDA